MTIRDNTGLGNTPPSASAIGAQQKAPTITTERLRDLGAIAEDFGHPIYAHALRAAADEIERLGKRVGDQLARISQLEQSERGFRQ